MSHITGYDRNQASIFPHTPEEMVSQESMVRVVDAFVDSLDLKELEFQKVVCKEEGRPPYEPGDLLKLYLYGYLYRTRSSRKLEHLCTVNVEVMWLLKGLQPSYKTIADFRKVHPKAIKAMFRKYVMMLKEWELVDGELVAIDGSKFRAVNSKKNNYNQKKIDRHLEYIDNRIDEFMQQLEQADKEECGDRKPDIKALKKKIETQKERRIEYEQLQKKLEESGEDQISTTDEDARALLIRKNIVEVSYNEQCSTDAKHNLIVNYKSTNENDRKALHETALETKNILGKETMEVLADKGYHNGEQLDACAKDQIVTFVPPPDIPRTNAIPTSAYHGDKFVYNESEDTYTCPAGNKLKTNGQWYQKGEASKNIIKVKHYKTPLCETCSVRNFCTSNKNGRLLERSQYAQAVEANNKRVRTQKEKYLLRQQIVEHPFGTIKRQWGFDHTLLKGLEKTDGEFGLVFLAYNLRRTMTIFGIKALIERLKSRSFELFEIILHYNTIKRFRKKFKHSKSHQLYHAPCVAMAA
jgi:transposase